jgi:ADP-ribose pyrophosphatase
VTFVIFVVAFMTVVYRGRVFSVEVDHVTLPNGRDHERAVVRHGPSVVLIPMHDDGRVVLVRQYRHPVGRTLWELPAGSVEPGETPEAAAARECEEEIREAPRDVVRLAGFFPAPGYCSEEMIYFRLAGLHPPARGSRHRPDDDEQIEARAFTVEEARAMLARGEIVDLKTAYGLALI